MSLSKTLSISYSPIGASAIVNQLKHFCEEHKVAEELVFQTCVVAAETLNNIIKHSPVSARDGFIKVTFDYHEDHLSLSLIYWCPEFAPPEEALCPDTDALSGRGWHIINSYMDRIRYHHHLGMNTLVLTKNLQMHDAA